MNAKRIYSKSSRKTKVAPLQKQDTRLRLPAASFNTVNTPGALSEPELASEASDLDGGERISLAIKLEKWAGELRRSVGLGSSNYGDN